MYLPLPPKRASLLLAALVLPLSLNAQYFKDVKTRGASAAGGGGGGIHAMAIGGAGSVPSLAAEPEFHAQQVTFRYTTQYDLRYYGFFSFSFWRPSAPAGWGRLGDSVVVGEDPSKVPVMIVKDEPPAPGQSRPSVVKPVDFDLCWGDDWNGFLNPGVMVTFWWPVAPEGYVPMGFAISKGTAKPDVNLYRCVRRDLVVEGRYEQIGTAFSNVPHMFHAFFTIKYDGSDPVVPANTMAYAWWDDRYVDPAFPRLPRTPNLNERGGVPHKHYHLPFLLKGLSGTDIHRDLYTGVYGEYTTRLAQSGLELAATIDNDDALAPKFGAFSGRLREALKTAKAERAPEPKRLRERKSTHVAGSAAPATLARSSSYSGPAPTHSHPPVNRNWAVGPTIAATETLPVRALRDIPGLKEVPFLAAAELTNATARQDKLGAGSTEPNQPYIVATGNISVNLPQLGTVTGKAVVLSRLYVQTGVKTGMLIFVPRDQIAAAAGLNDAALARLNLPSTVAVAFGTDYHQWRPNDLPPDLAPDLQAVLPAGHALVFRKDVTVLFKAGINGAVPIDGILASAPSEVVFTTIFPGPTNPKLKIITEPLGDFRMGFLPPGIDISKPHLEFSPGASLGLFSLLNLDVGGALKARVPLQFSVSTFDRSITVAGTIPGTWNNPLDIPELALGNMTLSGTLGGMAPRLGLAGDASFLGKSLHLAGDFTFAPAFSLSAFTVSDVTVSLQDLINAQLALSRAVGGGSIGGGKAPDLPDRLFEIRNAKVTVASLPNPALNIEQGTELAGQLFIAGTNAATIDAHVSPNNGLRIQADTVPLNLGPLALTGSGGHGGPHLDLLYWPVTQPPYDLRQHCYLSGQANVAGAPLDALVKLSRQKFELHLQGRLGGVFDASLEGTADNVIDDFTRIQDMIVNGTFSHASLDDLESRVLGVAGRNDVVKTALRLVGGSIIRVRAVSFTTYYRNVAAGGPVTLDVVCSVLGNDFTVQSTVALNGSGYSAVVNDLVNKVIAEAGNFTNVWNAAMKLVEDAAQEAARQAQQAYEASAKAVATAISATEDGVREAASQAKKAGETVINSITNAFKSLKFW